MPSYQDSHPAVLLLVLHDVQDGAELDGDGLYIHLLGWIVRIQNQEILTDALD